MSAEASDQITLLPGKRVLSSELRAGSWYFIRPSVQFEPAFFVGLSQEKMPVFDAWWQPQRFMRYSADRGYLYFEAISIVVEQEEKETGK